jgi:hypothetical protein
MRKELVAEPDTFARALDQPRYVDDGELASCVWRVDCSENGRERRERVVRNLRPRIGNACEERRFSGVRKSGERSVCEELQSEIEVRLVAGEPGLRETRNLARRAREA